MCEHNIFNGLTIKVFSWPFSPMRAQFDENGEKGWKSVTKTRHTTCWATRGSLDRPNRFACPRVRFNFFSFPARLFVWWEFDGLWLKEWWFGRRVNPLCVGWYRLMRWSFTFVIVAGCTWRFSLLRDDWDCYEYCFIPLHPCTIYCISIIILHSKICFIIRIFSELF